MSEDVERVTVGDRIRLSVALLCEWYDLPRHESPTVRLVKIARAEDGSLILHLQRDDDL